MARSKAVDKTSGVKRSSEQRIRARAVSRGVAVGKIVSLHGNKRQFYRRALEENQIEREIRRFQTAVRLARRHLIQIVQDKSGTDSGAQAEIFETHLLILEDNSLIDKIETAIRSQKVNAEWAVKYVTDRYISIYKDIQDEHLREKHIDLQDITERILTALGGGEQTNLKLEKNSIIVASEVRPSTLVELSRSDIIGIIAESGGWTSHTFILARELRIPAVTGIKGILRRVKTGDKAIVDGYHGQVIINPPDTVIAQYQEEIERFQQIKAENPEPAKGKLKTLDGREITIRANLDIGTGYAQAKKFGAAGVGLFRSEFLFNQYREIPSEAQQFEEYKKIAEIAGEDGARIRTFDINFDQLNEVSNQKEKNPSLGLRGIRLCFANAKVFRTQIRALLRASFENKLDILLPMISDLSEIISAKEVIEQEKSRLRKRKLNFGDPRIGVMIEVPSAIMMIEEIAEEVDFLSLGTNDLVQYLLGVDRDNELVAEWFRTLHPAVLRSLKRVIEASEKCRTPVIICGEMAASHVYAPILVGLGVTEMSMNITSMPRVRQVISNIAYEEARAVVKELEQCRTADEVEAKARENLISKWKHLFPPDILLPLKPKI